MPGIATSKPEVTHLSASGFRLLVDDRELFLAFDDFPWFRDAPVEQVRKVERPRPHHLRWPDLDVDLTLESIEHPESHPLVSRAKRG